jgi:CheY-like chemotaxis protein
MKDTKDAINQRAPASPRHVNIQLIDDNVEPIHLDGGISFSSNEKKAKPPTPSPQETKSHGTNGVMNPVQDSTKDPLQGESPTLRRHQSEPPPLQRRSIFRQYWEQETNEEESMITSLEMNAMPSSPAMRRLRSVSVSETPPCSVAQRRRSASIDIPGRLSQQASTAAALRRFAVPRKHQMSIGEHFVPVGQIKLGADRELPPLPSPLQRYFREDQRSELRGAYPLNAPSSILRQSSYRKLVASHSLPLLVSSFNLTETCHNKKEWSSRPQSFEEASSTSTSTARPRCVQFDPRVTVSEFQDKFEREWFSEYDLERFKCHTIALAQQYLVAHPELLEDYSKPRLDPITGVMRKKALYAMPVFSSVDESTLPEVVDSTCREMQLLVNREVKAILVVDPNPLVLNLFRRSLQPLYPNAKIAVAVSGEDALRVFRMAMVNISQGTQRGFDIVIAEERLARVSRDNVQLAQCGNSEARLDALPSRQANPKLVKQDSLSSISRSSAGSGISGSELFGKIDEMEREHCAGTSSQKEASSLGSERWCPLLVGVSMNSEADATAFIEKGADFVWSKVRAVFKRLNRVLSLSVCIILTNRPFMLFAAAAYGRWVPS